MNFDFAYSDDILAKGLNQLEESFTTINEESRFRQLVGASQSRSGPYQRWVKYREAYSPFLVKELLGRSEVNHKLNFVLDPMCGSGATLVAAAEMKFDCFGMDIMPYAVDVTNAKIKSYTLRDIREIKSFITKRHQTELNVSNLPRTMKNLEPYFDPDHLEVIRTIREAIRAIESKNARHLLLVAWLAILEDCSNRSKEGNGLATRRTRVHDVWKHYVSRVQMFLDDIRRHPLPSFVSAIAEKCSALKCGDRISSFGKEVNKELGVTIFSPPYANSFDYFESYKLELLAEYYDRQELISARDDAIRNYRKGYHRQLTTKDNLVQGLCDEIRSKIPRKEARIGRVDNRSRLVPNLLIGYFSDMERVLGELALCMPGGSLCYIVVDQSSYLGTIVPTDLLLANIAQRHECKVEKIIYCGRATTSAQQLKEYPYLGDTLRTSIVSIKRS